MNLDPRASAKLDTIADLILRGMEVPNPVLPGIVRLDLGVTTLPGGADRDIQHVSVEVGSTWVRAVWLPYNAVVVDKCCFVMRMDRRPASPWAVIATNYQVPLPPPIMIGVYQLIDIDPGPDDIQGTMDDDPGGEGESLMVDEDGYTLVEYA